MPSSHVVFEGTENVKLKIKENEKVNPILSCKSKAVNEEQLKKSGKNYVILRLGSVYGYSTDTARVIMWKSFCKNSITRWNTKIVCRR